MPANLAAMRHEALGDVAKVWLYGLATVLLGAWSAPWLFNAGKALAEVSAQKPTSGPVEWLAELCRQTDFGGFHRAAVIATALVLFPIWMEWIHARRRDAATGGPWRVRLPEGARPTDFGQALRRNPNGGWQMCAGFMAMAGLVLMFGVTLVPAGFFVIRYPGDGWWAPLAGKLLGALVVAACLETIFRGVATGIFMRALRPAQVLVVSAAFFALTLSMLPPTGVVLADPERGGAGFELLRWLAGRFADWRYVCGEFAPLLALGAVLTYARWRTASLWLPVGLHAGWLFAKDLLGSLSTPLSPETGETALNGLFLQQGVVPLAAVIATGLMARHLIADRHHGVHPAIP